jgi:hypothetical protein
LTLSLLPRACELWRISATTLFNEAVSVSEFRLPRGMMNSKGSWDSAVGVATGCGLDDRGGWSSSSGKVKNFLFSALSRPGSGALTASYLMGTGGSFPGGKAAGT